MRVAFLLLLALGWGPAALSAEEGLSPLIAAIEARDYDGFHAALINSAPFSNQESQGAEPGRYALEKALLTAPAIYLRACLDNGFDPNAVVEVGGREPEFYRGTFAYNVVLSGRTELLSGLKLTAASIGLKNASILFHSRSLTRLRVETLAEACQRMGDADSRAFAAKLASIGAEADPSDQRLDELIKGRVNDNRVRLRSGPGLSFAMVGQVESGTEVTVLESGPTRYLNQDPWADHWFRITTADKTGWVWGRYLDLSFEHGGALAGPLLVDFLLWKQKLYQDVWNRAQGSERWQMRSLVEWALQLEDKDFLVFLIKNKAPDSVFLGEESESLAAVNADFKLPLFTDGLLPPF